MLVALRGKMPPAPVQHALVGVAGQWHEPKRTSGGATGVPPSARAWMRWDGGGHSSWMLAATSAHVRSDDTQVTGTTLSVHQQQCRAPPPANQPLFAHLERRNLSVESAVSDDDEPLSLSLLLLLLLLDDPPRDRLRDLRLECFLRFLLNPPSFSPLLLCFFPLSLCFLLCFFFRFFADFCV